MVCLFISRWKNPQNIASSCGRIVHFGYFCVFFVISACAVNRLVDWLNILLRYIWRIFLLIFWIMRRCHYFLIFNDFFNRYLAWECRRYSVLWLGGIGWGREQPRSSLSIAWFQRHVWLPVTYDNGWDFSDYIMFILAIPPLQSLFTQ